MRKLWSKFLILATFVFVFSYSHADDINIRQYPERPRAGEEVRINLLSNVYNLNIADITWTLDGVEIDTGIGRKTVFFKTNLDGRSQNLLVFVEQEGLNSQQISIDIVPNTNYLIYEGVDSYVPTFYKGRRLPAREGTVRVAYFAFSEGEIANLTGDGSYEWNVNGEERVEYTGAGRILNSILTRITDTALTLQVTKYSNNGVASIAEEVIPLESTQTLLFRTDADQIIKYPVKQIEATRNLYIVVEPYYFSVLNKRDPNLVYTWKMNDIAYPVSTPWSVVFEGKDPQDIKMNLKVINNKKITQESDVGFTFKVE